MRVPTTKWTALQVVSTLSAVASGLHWIKIPWPHEKIQVSKEYLFHLAITSTLGMRSRLILSGFVKANPLDR
jgi:hypothetical protein